MTTLGTWALLIAVVGWVVWMWLELRAAEIDAAKRRHPSNQPKTRRLTNAELAPFAAAHAEENRKTLEWIAAVEGARLVAEVDEWRQS